MASLALENLQLIAFTVWTIMQFIAIKYFNRLIGLELFGKNWQHIQNLKGSFVHRKKCEHFIKWYSMIAKVSIIQMV